MLFRKEKISTGDYKLNISAILFCDSITRPIYPNQFFQLVVDLSSQPLGPNIGQIVLGWDVFEDNVPLLHLFTDKEVSYRDFLDALISLDSLAIPRGIWL